MIPIRTLRGPNDEATEIVRLMVYVDELDFQAKIALDAFERAWVTALKPDGDDDAVWADLQAALFSLIIIDRMIRPRGVKGDKAKGITQDVATVEAERRAKALRGLLSIPEDPVRNPGDPDGSRPQVLHVAPVRNSFEHIDERFDQLVLTDVMSISDRYVSRDGRYLRTYDTGDGTSGANFRVFIPAAGRLIFDGQALDMFVLDHHLLSLRGNLEGARTELADRLEQTRTPGDGGYYLGGQQYVSALRPDHRNRVRAFLTKRAEHGLPIKAEVQFGDPDESAAE